MGRKCCLSDYNFLLNFDLEIISRQQNFVKIKMIHRIALYSSCTVPVINILLYYICPIYRDNILKNITFPFGEKMVLIVYLANISSWLRASLVAQLVKKSVCNVGDLGSIPGLERSPGEGKSYPLPYPGLENSMDCIVHGISKSQTWLSNFHSSWLN